MIDRADLRSVLTAYLRRHPDEVDKLAVVSGLLDRGADLTNRRHWDGHVTVSGVVINSGHQVLLIDHRASGKELPPGGHLDPADETLHGAVVREVCEETGVASRDLSFADDLPIHVDVQRIAAREHKGEPDHFHFDLRYLLTSAGDSPLRPQLDEVSAARWADPAELGDPVLSTIVRARLSAG